MQHNPRLIPNQSDGPTDLHRARCSCGWETASKDLEKILLLGQAHRAKNPNEWLCELSEDLGSWLHAWLLDHAVPGTAQVDHDEDHTLEPAVLLITLTDTNAGVEL